MKKITLTFDNGPTPGVTDRVLDLLEKHAIKSTFMAIGNNLHTPDARALLADIVAAGHWVGNHTLTHSVAFGDRPEAGYAEHEMAETQRLMGEFARPEKIFRPYGNKGLLGPHLFSRAALAYLLENTMTCVLWNSVPHDWDDQAGWVDRAMAQAQAQDHTVVVLHDIEDAAAPRLDEFIGRLRDAGMQFEQSFPDAVVATRGGRILSLPTAYISDYAAA
jgi:peptidoglycan/xylan/chitin deacetylase (PgdA/CDA1 family)